jgi:flavin reductase (DIM6/NTAB) family NADH-FMN oxidoreductase RutF
MFYEPRKNDHGLPHNPFKALVAPRPIGWVTTLSVKGEVNLSPYSYFNAVSDRPDMVVFSSAGYKDAITFAEETGEFVCNFATWDEVVGTHIDDRFIRDGIVDTAAMRPIARAGYREYFVATPETKFAMTRPDGG